MRRYQIDENHYMYYEYLEKLRVSGVTNMWGAADYLYKAFYEISYEDAQEILMEWIENYSELNKKFGWQK